MNRRKFLGTLAGAGAALAANKVIAGPATSGLRSNFAFKKEDTPVILEVAINGSATKKVNPTAPETPAEIAQQAIECLDAGATIIHAHTNQPMEDADAAAQTTKVGDQRLGVVEAEVAAVVDHPGPSFDLGGGQGAQHPERLIVGRGRHLGDARRHGQGLDHQQVGPARVLDARHRDPQPHPGHRIPQVCRTHRPTLRLLNAPMAMLEFLAGAAGTGFIAPDLATITHEGLRMLLFRGLIWRWCIDR